MHRYGLYSPHTITAVLTTQENGHPSRTKKDLPNFCLEKESLRLFIIYTDGRKKEYRFSLKKDKVAKVFDTVVKLEQVDSTRDVKLRNLRTN